MKIMPIFPLICVLLAATLHLAVQEGTLNLGAIVDSTSWSGKIAKTALKLARDDVNNQSHLLNGTRMFLHLREAKTPLETVSAAVDLLGMEVMALIQTQTSEAAPFVSDLGEAANVPILSLSAVLSNQRFPYFVRMAHSEMEVIAALVKHYNWTRIVFLHSDDDFGSGALSALRDALRDQDSEIVYTSVIPSTAQKQTIREELYKLKTIKSSVFVVHTPSDLGMSLFMEAQEMGMMGTGYIWITTQEFTSLWDYVVNVSTMSSLQGLLGIKSRIPDSKELNDFTERWERQFHLDNPKVKNSELNGYGLLAYDTVLMIARAMGKMERNTRLSFLKPSTSHGLIPNTKIKVFQQGEKLLKQIFLTNFSGLSGPVKFHEGEMYGSSYEIVNVVGKSYQIVGYWPYNSSNLFKTPSFGEGLGPVIWPGGSVTVSRGWVIPSPTRLKIAVPVSEWKQLVNVSYNTDSKETTFSGFIIDVFDAIAKKLDYELLYDFIAFSELDNYSEGYSYSYDDLVRQVYLKKYDAVVGDVTIKENRSEIVGFTQAFTETGLVMVAPTAIREEAHKSWTFIQPFTPGLWATTAAFVLFTGLVVWLLERKINPDFRGSPINQAVTLIWFAFSAIFQAHQERIHKSLSRIVLVNWMFVTFILTSSYTANLSSRLTTQRIAPLVNGLGDYEVGYQSSYVGSFLTDNLGIAQKQLVPHSSPEKYEEALSKGAKNGGVDAILDEIPYVRAFLSGRCNYSIVGRTYRKGRGFGFVFRKDSLLLEDFSRGISHLLDSKDIKAIEDKYFNDNVNTCLDINDYSTRLNVRSFRELYLIRGLVSSLALTIYIYQYVYNFTKVLISSRQDMWKIIKPFVNYLYHEQVSSQA